MRFIIVGKNERTTKKIHDSMNKQRRAFGRLFSIMKITKTIDGAVLSTKNKLVLSYLNPQDFVNQLIKGFGEDCVRDIDYVIEVEE